MYCSEYRPGFDSCAITCRMKVFVVKHVSAPESHDMDAMDGGTIVAEQL